MIKCKFSNNYNHIEIKGHANSGKHGKDLVCAGVSCIATGFLNFVSSYKTLKLETKYKSGYICVDLDDKDKSQKEIEILLFKHDVLMLIDQLTTIAQAYGEYISVEIK